MMCLKAFSLNNNDRPRAANEAVTPQIKMIVSNWYTDELCNQARFIKARD
jgi:hypothetical protein